MRDEQKEAIECQMPVKSFFVAKLGSCCKELNVDIQVRVISIIIGAVGRGGGLVVNILTSYSADLSLSSAGYRTKIFCTKRRK